MQVYLDSLAELSPPNQFSLAKESGCNYILCQALPRRSPRLEAGKGPVQGPFCFESKQYRFIPS